MANESMEPDQGISVELKDPGLAAFLGWLIPGLGHLYQGRTAKGVLFFVCIMGTYLYGLYLGGSSELGWGRVVYASWRENDKRLPYLCQLGMGLPALPALVQARRVRDGKQPFFHGFMAAPRLDGDLPGQPSLDTLHKKLARYFELGTVYTMIAGLLNILAVYDAWGGPVFLEQKKEEEQEGEEDERKEEPEGPQPEDKSDAPSGDES